MSIDASLKGTPEASIRALSDHSLVIRSVTVSQYDSLTILKNQAYKPSVRQTLEMVLVFHCRLAELDAATVQGDAEFYRHRRGQVGRAARCQI